MESNQFSSLEEILLYRNTNEDLSNFFYVASKYMKLLHKNGLYITNFEPKHLKYNEESVVFERTDRITNRIIGDEVKSNIEAFTSLMVGSYINYTSSLLPISKLKEYYPEVKYSFPPQDVEYFNMSLNENKTMYYCDYVDQIKVLGSENFGQNDLKRINIKSLSTPEGRALSEKNVSLSRQAAFANVLIVSAIVCLITIVAVLTYVILK